MDGRQWPLGAARGPGQVERAVALQRRLPGQRLVAGGDGLPGALVVHRSGAAAGDRVRADSALWQHRSERRRGDKTHEPFRRVVGEGRRALESGQCLCHRLPPRSLVGFHLLPERYRPDRQLPARRSVRAAGPAPRLWRQRRPHLVWRLGRAGRRGHARPAIAFRRHRPPRPVRHHRQTALGHGQPGPGGGGQPELLRREPDGMA